MEETKYILTEQDAYNFHLSHKRLSKTEVGEQILTHTGLPIRDVELMLEKELIDFERAQAVARKRLSRLIERVQKKRYSPSTDTFFDLNDFPSLIKEDSQHFSQYSASSTNSWLEDLEPSEDTSDSRKRKPFGEVGSRTKRRRTDDIFEQLRIEAKRLDLSVVQLIGFLGYRASYLENKHLATTFKNISEGNDTDYKKQVPLDLCMYIREQCELGKKIGLIYDSC